MPKIVKHLKIAKGLTSTVWDYRQETPPSGGIIDLGLCVHHIPVIRNQPGRSDLDQLRRVLLDQDLMVQFGSDREGNVAMYTKANRLCYHARGANSVSCGIEHMHYAVGEAWSLRQMRAAGWIAQYLEREFKIPLQMGKMEPGGNRQVKVVRKGHTSHAQVSKVIGLNDRSDPGPGFDFEQMFSYARYFRKNGHFIGA